MKNETEVAISGVESVMLEQIVPGSSINSRTLIVNTRDGHKFEITLYADNPASLDFAIEANTAIPSDEVITLTPLGEEIAKTPLVDVLLADHAELIA